MKFFHLLPLLFCFILAKLLKVVLKMVEKVFSAALSNPASEEFQKLKTEVEQAVNFLQAFVSQIQLLFPNHYKHSILNLVDLRNIFWLKHTVKCEKGVRPFFI